MLPHAYVSLGPDVIDLFEVLFREMKKQCKKGKESFLFLADNPLSHNIYANGILVSNYTVTMWEFSEAKDILVEESFFKETDDVLVVDVK